MCPCTRGHAPFLAAEPRGHLALPAWAIFQPEPPGQSCLSAGLLAERRVSGEHHPGGREEAPLVQVLPPVWERTSK